MGGRKKGNLKRFQFFRNKPWHSGPGTLAQWRQASEQIWWRSLESIEWPCLISRWFERALLWFEASGQRTWSKMVNSSPGYFRNEMDRWRQTFLIVFNITRFGNLSFSLGVILESWIQENSNLKHTWLPLIGTDKVALCVLAIILTSSY